jgi:hypothetical protein
MKALEDIYSLKPEFEKCRQTLISELKSKSKEIENQMNLYLKTGIKTSFE